MSDRCLDRCREPASTGGMEMLIASSFSKNFGLYTSGWER